MDSLTASKPFGIKPLAPEVARHQGLGVIAGQEFDSFRAHQLTPFGGFAPERISLTAPPCGLAVQVDSFRAHQQRLRNQPLTRSPGAGRVEAKRGSVQARRRRVRTSPFRACSRREGHHSVSPAPLIEPDVTISVIRLSDGFHATACAAADARASVATRHPAPRKQPAWETADNQTRPACAGGAGSDERCGRDTEPHRGALS